MDVVQESFEAAKKRWLKLANTSDGTQASKPGGTEKHPNTTYRARSLSLSHSIDKIKQGERGKEKRKPKHLDN